jgi:hypothetical protein
MKSGSRYWLQEIQILVVFLVAFLPRVIYPVSRPTQWYTRSVMFIHSILDRAWGETVYSEHPGVTALWLSGIALRVTGVTPEERPDGPYVDPDALTAQESAIGVLPLALVVAVLIVLMYLLIMRLFDRTTAFSAALLVALDPFFIANSKVFHTDGLLAAFLSTSALALLVFMSERRWRWVILSGALAGLALLTKSPALFLVPYTALCLGVSSMVNRPMTWRRNVLAGLIWLAALASIYWMLFPAMWVDPVGTLKTVYERAALRISWAHPNPVYFLGRAFIGDPGPTYYLYTWGHKATSVVSVFAPIALIYATLGKTPSRHRRMTVGLIFAFAFFFTIQMTLGAKKMPYYLLPAFPLIDILAGAGLVWWAERIANRKSQIANRKSPFSIALIALGLLLQAALALPHHPYYDTYFSELTGGTRAGIQALSTQWQGEGLDIAAQMLNKLPDAEHQTVGSNKAVMFRQYFVGQTMRTEDPADWQVFAINNVMRGEGVEAGSQWDFYSRRQPWATVSFGETPYVWVYRAGTGPQNPVTFTFRHGIRLIGYDVPPPPYHPGQTLRLQLYWQALEPVAEDYTVFVHVLDQAGQLVAQQDNPPVRGTRPTSTWEPGTVIVDPYDLLIPQDAPVGDYAVTLGLYRLADLSRLPVRDDTGATLPDSRVPLIALHVEQEPAVPGVWVARGLAALVLLSAAATLRKRSL